MTKEYNQRVEDALEALTQAGTYKFMVHSSKGDWNHKTKEVLLAELKREVEELEEAITTGKGKEAIVSEIGDIANYAAMLLDKEIK
jgi:hypothetical protein